MNLLAQTEQVIARRELLQTGQGIVLGVSGGVDSIALLHLLNKLSKTYHWVLHAAHLNHQLRGRSSDADEKLVRAQCRKLKIPVTVERADVRGLARKEKLSTEMAARNLRHDFFATVARKQNISTIALAHHADDQVELFFLRLLRGTSVEGLAGMGWTDPSPADNRLTIVRPLLGFSKREIIDYARSEKLRFREDATNRRLDILRNRIRRQLIPLLQKHYQPAIGTTVLRLMEILRAESEFIASTIAQTAPIGDKRSGTPKSADPILPLLRGEGPGEGKGTIQTPGVTIQESQSVPRFDTLPIALQRRLLHKELVDLRLAPNFDLIEQLRQLPQIPIMLEPRLVITRRPSGRLEVKRLTEASFSGEQLVVSLAAGAGSLQFSGVAFDWVIVSRLRSAAKAPKATPGVELFDADKVGPSIVLRHWQPGDRFHPIGLPRPTKLQDLFVNLKIPRPQRHNLLLAATPADEIVWVEGLRISERFKLDTASLRRLKWSWHRA